MLKSPVRFGFVLSAVVAGASLAHAYGPEGHRLAGLIADSRLCTRAERAIETLAPGQTLATLGLWADRVRRIERFAHSAPWHYMNIDDGRALSEYTHPPEGDVLWAITHFRAVLADERLSRASRGEALRYLVHFVVDLHQPLHVGRSTDRGGNTIDIVLADGTVTLHRFWDTEALDWRLSRPERAARLEALIAGRQLAAGSTEPFDWAAESLALRAQVYTLPANGRPGVAYLDAARAVTEQRLSLAGLRLAAQLNGIYCP